MTSLAAGVDGQVRRISKTYGAVGRVETLTSYTHPYPKTGSIVNEVLFEYNDTGLPSAEYQSHSGAVDVVSTPKVQYGYDDTLDGEELVKGLRPVSLTYPNGRIVRYEYAEASSSSGAGDDPDDLLNRIKFIADDDEGAVGTHFADYTRLGLDSIVQVDYTQPQIRYDLAHGTADDPYDGLDRFGRVKDLLWRNYGTGEDVVRIRHGYDRAGNRLYRQDPVAAAHGVDMDEAYTYDGLYQLKTFVRGALNAQKTAIAAPTFRQAWDFDATGNWTRCREDTDGDGHWDLDQTRQHNAVNEITAIDAAVGQIWVSPTHDRNGNMLRIPQPNDPTKQFTLKWDAWNRLVKVSDAESVVAEYQYDARNFRILKRLHVDPDQLPTFHCPLPTPQTRHFYYNSAWQCLEERSEENGAFSADAERQFVWGLRYIDDLIVRDRDTMTSGSLGEAGSGLDERLYALQDPNWNVVAIAGTDGAAIERCLFAAYGKPTFLTSSLGDRGPSSYAWDTLYTGRTLDAETSLCHYRVRHYSARSGRFTSRDPIGYRDDENLYRYCGGSPANATDPSGRRFEEEMEYAVSKCAWTCSCENKRKVIIGLWERLSPSVCLYRLAVGDFPFEQYIKQWAEKIAGQADELATTITTKYGRSSIRDLAALRHCMASAAYARVLGCKCAACLGYYREQKQYINGTETFEETIHTFHYNEVGRQCAGCRSAGSQYGDYVAPPAGDFASAEEIVASCVEKWTSKTIFDFPGKGGPTVEPDVVKPGDEPEWRKLFAGED